MSHKLYIPLLLTFACLHLHARAQALLVTGDIPTTGPLTLAAAQSLHPTPLAIAETDTTHTYTGVPLEKALTKFGFGHGDLGHGMPRSQKRGGWKKKVIAATAADGYQVFFSGAEITAELGNTTAWLVWQADGKPLPSDQGPFKLVVPSDKDDSRWVYTLRRIDIVDMRRIVPSSTAN